MLKQMADFFHTSVDYLIGYTANPVAHTDEALFLDTQNFSKELHHLSLYQGLSPHVQDHLDAILEEL